MKKIMVVLIVIFMALGLTGCGGTKLTKENCKDYLEISVESHTNVYAKNYHGTFYDGAYGEVTVNGVSSNYDYKDVEVVILVHYTEIWTPEANFWNFAGNKKNEYQYEEVTVEVPVKLNIAGNGSESFEAEFFTCMGKTYAGGFPTGPVEDLYFHWPSEVEAHYEIKSVSGTVAKPQRQISIMRNAETKY